ncbi:MAG: transposase, partial [Chlamydiia bacterium]|nr:transposase [Chlamydiia bacterium]
QVFPNLTLLPLPPASPELNPCEQIWKHLRRKHLSNRCFQDDEDLLTACSEAWNDFIDDSELVTSLCSRDWAHV